jgi:hypothetical protein
VREGNLQGRICDALNEHPHCKAVITRGLEAGTPDILGCRRGRMFAVEVKSGGAGPTAIQRHRLRQWEDAGAFCTVADEEFSVREFLEAIGETTSSL